MFCICFETNNVNCTMAHNLISSLIIGTGGRILIKSLVFLIIMKAMSEMSYRIKHEHFPQIKHDPVRKPLRSTVVKNTAYPFQTATPLTESLLPNYSTEKTSHY